MEDVHNYGRTVRPRMTEIGTIRQVRKSMFSGVSHAAVERGRGSRFSQTFWTSYIHVHSIRNNNQILLGDQTRREVNFYTVDHEC